MDLLFKLMLFKGGNMVFGTFTGSKELEFSLQPEQQNRNNWSLSGKTRHNKQNKSSVSVLRGLEAPSHSWLNPVGLLPGVH